MSMVNAANPPDFHFISGDVYTVIGGWLSASIVPDIALVTITEIDGRSPYPVGTQLAVNSEGQYCGYLTSGCAENAILHHAIESMSTKKVGVERYGKGSPYIDIVLPCGSGITVLIDPTLSHEMLGRLVDLKRTRQAFCIETNLAQGEHSLGLNSTISTSNPPSTQLLPDRFVHYHAPVPKLILVGQGPILSALASHALASGFHVDAYYDDEQSISSFDHANLHVQPARRALAALGDIQDNHCGFVSLYHEHEKEIPLLVKALQTNLFYLGALGSNTTHQHRLDALRMEQISEPQLSKIRGPIGLPIGAKTPEHIAISVLAEIIGELGQV